MFTFVQNFLVQQNRLENLQELVWAWRKHSRIFFFFVETSGYQGTELLTPRPQLTYTALLRSRNNGLSWQTSPRILWWEVGRRRGDTENPHVTIASWGWKSGSLPQNIGPFLGDLKICFSVDGGSNRSSTTCHCHGSPASLFYNICVPCVPRVFPMRSLPTWGLALLGVGWKGKVMRKAFYSHMLSSSLGLQDRCGPRWKNWELHVPNKKNKVVEVGLFLFGGIEVQVQA